MNGRVLLCCSALALLLFGGQAQSVARPASWCGQLLADYRSKLVDAERYPPTTLSNAYRRYYDIVNGGGFDVDAGGVGLPDRSQMFAYFTRETGAEVAQQCGEATGARWILYGDVWPALLKGQALPVFLPQDARCKNVSEALIRLTIVNVAAEFAPWVDHFGVNDPDVRHITGLLRPWASQNGVRLPALGDRANVDRLVPFYAKMYHKAYSATPGC